MTHSVLALHHGYRVAGGEERAAEQLADLAERELGERVAWLRRDSTAITGVDAARGLLAGGLGGRQVTEALERTGADLLHAHNLFPTFGPVALRAARKQGAAVVVHLHNTRLVCAVATNVRDGRDCTECHGSWSVPGIRHRCRGSLPESVAYGAALPRWRKEVVAIADAVIVPSLAARSRLLALGLGVPLNQIHVVGGVAPTIADRSTASTGRFALLVGRLAPEKDIATAIEACAAIGLPLVIAGDGPEAAALQSLAGVRAPAEAVRRAAAPPPDRSANPWAAGPPVPSAAARGVKVSASAAAILGDELTAALPQAPVVRGSTVFLGRVDDAVLALLRANARVSLTPSLAHETFGLAALESMAAAVPTIGTRVGALPELLGDDAVVEPRDVPALRERLRHLAGDDAAGLQAAQRARELAGPPAVAAKLREAYAAAREHGHARGTYA